LTQSFSKQISKDSYMHTFWYTHKMLGL